MSDFHGLSAPLETSRKAKQNDKPFAKRNYQEAVGTLLYLFGKRVVPGNKVMDELALVV